MERNKKEFQGTGKVFSFTFVQMLKNKGNMLTLLLMMVMCLVSVPVMLWSQGAEAAKASHSGAQRIIVKNDTDVPADWSAMFEADPYYQDVSIETGSDEIGLEQAGSENADETVLFLQVSQGRDGYEISAKTVSGSSDETEINRLLQTARTGFQDARCLALGIDSTSLDALNQGFEIETASVSDVEEPERNDFSTRYWLQYAYAILVMILSMMSVSYIVRAIIEEKEYKLVETLMVSIKPLALIAGKILAAMAFVFGMFAGMAVCLVVSYEVSGLFFEVGSVSEILASAGISTAALQLDPGTIAGFVISIFTGYLTFSLLAGLFGSACSSMSDMQSAIMGPTMIILAGYLISVIVSGFDGGPVVIAACVCPVVSVFCAPIQYLVGNISLPVLAAAWVLQLATALIIARFCAKVYRELIIYRGSRVSFGRMLAMAKKRRKGSE